MDIELLKINSLLHSVKIIRNDGSTEQVELDSKTYFLHDLCHYVVEKHLHTSEGFWGMLSKGYRFNELSGKTNELTAELRFIEKIVGPIQSIVSGYLPAKNFAQAVAHLDSDVASEVPAEALVQTITAYQAQWKSLPYGHALQLTF